MGLILINHQETWELFKYELCEALEWNGDAKGMKQRKLTEIQDKIWQQIRNSRLTRETDR